MPQDAPARSDALVLFGATGDLAKKKLFPALYLLTKAGRLDIPVVGVAKSDWDDTAMRQHARDDIVAACPDADPAVIDQLLGIYLDRNRGFGRRGNSGGENCQGKEFHSAHTRSKGRGHKAGPHRPLPPLTCNSLTIS